jgi:hypothetical protein
METIRAMDTTRTSTPFVMVRIVAIISVVDIRNKCTTLALQRIELGLRHVRWLIAGVAWIATALLAILSPYAMYVDVDSRGSVLLILMFGIIISGAIACRYTVRD